MKIAVHPLPAALGAEISGVDLAQALDDATLDEIRDALLKHHVLVFRGQDFDEQAHIAFSRKFGEIQVHVLNQYHGKNPKIFIITNLDANDRPTGVHPDPGAAIWHIDGSWSSRPGLATMLYGIEVPTEGADTIFADLCAAYDALDDQRKAELDGLRAVHDLNDSRQRSGARVQMTAEQRAAAPPVEHPIVRTHPDTGRKSLYLGEHACYVAGWPEPEGREFVDSLNRHTTQSAFLYRHRWQPGDFVMWDNRCTMHKATDFDTARDRRVIRRTTVIGDHPE